MAARAALAALFCCLLFGCGDGGKALDATATSAIGDGTNCAEMGSRQRQRLEALGCDDDVADVEAYCETVYAGGGCLTEWEALASCLYQRPDRDFQCDANNELEPRAGVCDAESALFAECRW
jgi:hypothetical protein